MKLFQALINLHLLSLPLRAHADNTPDLCTADIPHLEQIKPSDTYTGEAAAFLPLPDITVGGETYSSDAEHFVTRPPLLYGDEVYKQLIVYIPGTTDRPALSSCLLKSVAKLTEKKGKTSRSEHVPRGVPVIGLSYQYLSSGDSYRNGKCASLATETSNAEQVNCLKEQHEDALYGGDYGNTHFVDGATAPFWDKIKKEHSLFMRLFYLLQHLDATYPNDGWKTFYSTHNIDGKYIGPTIAWSNIIVSGHSQGAGHVGYLAKTKRVRGAVMISGPQDNCDGCEGEDDKFWIDEGPYAARQAKYTALGHGDEPMHDIQVKNWLKMQAVAGGKMQWGSLTTPFLNDVGFGLKVKTDTAQKGGPLITYVKHGAESTCGGKEHCSTAIDDSVPFFRTYTNETYYLYEDSVWPSIFRVFKNGMGFPQCRKAPPGWTGHCDHDLEEGYPE